jgi:hypothetical protein
MQAHAPGFPSGPQTTVVVAAPEHTHATLLPGVQLVTVAAPPLPGGEAFELHAEITKKITTPARRALTRKTSNISGSRVPRTVAVITASNSQAVT